MSSGSEPLEASWNVAISGDTTKLSKPRESVTVTPDAEVLAQAKMSPKQKKKTFRVGDFVEVFCGEPKPYIARISSIGLDASNTLVAKMQWFYRYTEISTHKDLKGHPRKPNSNELILSSHFDLNAIETILRHVDVSFVAADGKEFKAKYPDAEDSESSYLCYYEYDVKQNHITPLSTVHLGLLKKTWRFVGAVVTMKDELTEASKRIKPSRKSTSSGGKNDEKKSLELEKQSLSESELELSSLGSSELDAGNTTKIRRKGAPKQRSTMNGKKRIKSSDRSLDASESDDLPASSLDEQESDNEEDKPTSIVVKSGSYPEEEMKSSGKRSTPADVKSVKSFQRDRHDLKVQSDGEKDFAKTELLEAKRAKVSRDDGKKGVAAGKNEDAKALAIYSGGEGHEKRATAKAATASKMSKNANTEAVGPMESALEKLLEDVRRSIRKDMTLDSGKASSAPGEQSLKQHTELVHSDVAPKGTSVAVAHGKASKKGDADSTPVPKRLGTRPVPNLPSVVVVNGSSSIELSKESDEMSPKARDQMISRAAERTTSIPSGSTGKGVAQAPKSNASAESTNSTVRGIANSNQGGQVVEKVGTVMENGEAPKPPRVEQSTIADQAAKGSISLGPGSLADQSATLSNINEPSASIKPSVPAAGKDSSPTERMAVAQSMVPKNGESKVADGRAPVASDLSSVPNTLLSVSDVAPGQAVTKVAREGRPMAVPQDALRGSQSDSKVKSGTSSLDSTLALRAPASAPTSAPKPAASTSDVPVTVRQPSADSRATQVQQAPIPREPSLPMVRSSSTSFVATNATMKGTASNSDRKPAVDVTAARYEQPNLESGEIRSGRAPEGAKVGESSGFQPTSRDTSNPFASESLPRTITLKQALSGNVLDNEATTDRRLLWKHNSLPQASTNSDGSDVSEKQPSTVPPSARSIRSSDQTSGFEDDGSDTPPPVIQVDVREEEEPAESNQPRSSTSKRRLRANSKLRMMLSASKQGSAEPPHGAMRIGEEYQAIPPELRRLSVGSARPAEDVCDSQLIWSPSHLSSQLRPELKLQELLSRRGSVVPLALVEPDASDEADRKRVCWVRVCEPLTQNNQVRVSPFAVSWPKAAGRPDSFIVKEKRMLLWVPRTAFVVSETLQEEVMYSSYLAANPYKSATAGTRDSSYKRRDPGSVIASWTESEYDAFCQALNRLRADQAIGYVLHKAVPTKSPSECMALFWIPRRGLGAAPHAMGRCSNCMNHLNPVVSCMRYFACRTSVCSKCFKDMHGRTVESDVEIGSRSTAFDRARTNHWFCRNCSARRAPAQASAAPGNLSSQPVRQPKASAGLPSTLIQPESAPAAAVRAVRRSISPPTVASIPPDHPEKRARTAADCIQLYDEGKVSAEGALQRIRELIVSEAERYAGLTVTNSMSRQLPLEYPSPRTHAVIQPDVAFQQSVIATQAPQPLVGFGPAILPFGTQIHLVPSVYAPGSVLPPGLRDLAMAPGAFILPSGPFLQQDTAVTDVNGLNGHAQQYPHADNDQKAAPVHLTDVTHAPESNGSTATVHDVGSS